LSRTLRARDNGAADSIRCLRGAKRRTTTRMKPTSAVKAFGFSALAAYPPPRWVGAVGWDEIANSNIFNGTIFFRT